MRDAIAKQVAVLQLQLEVMHEQLHHVEQLLVLLAPEQPELPDPAAPAPMPHETPLVQHAAPQGGTSPAGVDWNAVDEALKRLTLLTRGVGLPERNELAELLLHSGRGPVDRAKVRQAVARARSVLGSAHPMAGATLDELLTLVGA